MELQLMPDYLAVELEEEKTPGGILLSDTVTREKPSKGKITHVGGKDTTFKKDQVVLFEKYGAIEIVVGKEKIYVIDKRDVIGILE